LYRACPIKDKENVDFSKEPTSWKIIMEPKTGNVITSEVNALMYVILSKVEEHVPY